MELGGNAPFIVFEDANIDKAVEGAVICKFRASGQTCVCANRIYVHEEVLETFTARFIEKLKQFRLGRGLYAVTTHRPSVDASAVKKPPYGGRHTKGRAVEIWCKGSDSSGFFFEPTIITGAHKDMLLVNNETFGPLTGIFSFNSEEDVLQQANDSDMGLTGFFSARMSTVFSKWQKNCNAAWWE
ncbi:hypothetical protein AJ79_06789 [Helicocarpus griseus UAMH5409]|uniref:Succinate-semialdehyde dehydrogenase, mitochondrial n=1 Tax=Helicocarpus griseus UAMH5409 TaxID=1447875 RepID=A0A2B7X9S7_9EURO|nr:hypothetical protein AJ79_06789 [Helicocarpus griseus UAMH5409]